MLCIWDGLKNRTKILFNNKYSLQRILLNVDDLMLKYNIKLDNKHSFKLVSWWNELFRIQRADSIKDIYILNKMNEIRLKRTYADNRLKRYKTKNIKSLSIK